MAGCFVFYICLNILNVKKGLSFIVKLCPGEFFTLKCLFFDKMMVVSAVVLLLD